jgi:hypothetical protein
MPENWYLENKYICSLHFDSQVLGRDFFREAEQVHYHIM